MRTIEQSAYDALSASTALAALVSTRIYPDEIPQAQTLPAVVYEVSNTEPLRTIHGAVAAISGSVEVSVWAASRAQALSVLQAVISAMQSAGHTWDGDAAVFAPDTGDHAFVARFEIFEVN